MIMTTPSKRLLLALPLVLALAACGPSGPAFSPVAQLPENKALVYIYRTGALGAAVTYTVHDGNQEVVELQTGGYYPYLAEPGEREFWARTEAKASTTEQLRPGETYYLKGGIGVGFLVGHPKLAFVSREVGEREIKGCRLIKTK